MVNIVMIGSDLSVKGGMTTVVRSYLQLAVDNDIKYKFIPTHIEGSLIEKVLFFIKEYFKIKRASKHHNIFHIHVSERGSFKRKAIVANLLLRKNKKVIFHHHGPELLEYFSSSSVKHQNYIKRIIESVDFNLVLSQEMKERLERITKQAKIEILFNGVVPEKSNRYNSNGKIILYLGKIGNRKGAFDLLNSIQQIDHMIDKKYVFYFCGNGEVNKLRDMIIEKNLVHRVPVVKWITNEEKETIFKEVVLNVLPSYHEGLPMTILETMAYGIPNISTRINSIPEVISNERLGILIEPGHVDDLTQAIHSLLINQEVRENISHNAFELINDKFNLIKIMAKLKCIYDDLDGERR